MPEQNNNKEELKQKNIKKEGFFKKVIKSIKDFDKYEDFGLEGMGKTSLYLLQIVAIFTLVVSVMTVYKFSNSLSAGMAYFDENIQSLSYENGILEVNSNQKLEVDSQENITGKIIIDTSDLTDEQIEEYKNEIKEQTNGIVLLKDKVLLKNEMLSAITETSYADFFSQYNINSLDKQTILYYFNSNQVQIYTTIFAGVYIYMFAIYIASILVDAIVLGALGFLIARIIGMKIRYSATFRMGVHALTLPIILNMLYVILNGFTGCTIKYFQFMYTAISYIYIITAIFIIKSDYIKRQAEVEKIQTEQEKVRQELEAQKQKQEDDKVKRKEEKERQEQKEKERKEKKKKEKEEHNVPDIGDKPEGSSV